MIQIRLRCRRAVLRTHDILVWIRIRGSMLLTMDSDTDPDPKLDPDFATFLINLQDANKKMI
jgi:hypothetical protein